MIPSVLSCPMPLWADVVLVLVLIALVALGIDIARVLNKRVPPGPRQRTAATVRLHRSRRRGYVPRRDT